MQTPLEKAINILTEAKIKAIAELTGSEYTFPLIKVESGLNALINNLSFQSGGAFISHNINKEEFLPVTNFMGEELIFPNEITEADIKYPENDKEFFLKNVADLQATIRDRQPREILKDFSTGMHVMELRKVARNAGLPDYETGPLTVDFVNRIKKGLDDIDRAKKRDEEIDKQLQ